MLKFFLFFLAFVICASNSSFASNKVASVGKYEVTKQEAELATKMAGLGDFDKLSVDAKKVIVTRLLNDKILEGQSKKEKINEQKDVIMVTRAILVSKYIEKHSGNLEVLAKKKYDETTSTLKDKKAYTFLHILVKNEIEANKIYKM